MTKSDVMKEFLKKTVIPVVVALFLFSMFSRIFIENGAFNETKALSKLYRNIR